MMGRVMDMARCAIVPALVMALIFSAASEIRGAEWEIGAKIGYDSNVNQSLDDEQDDTVFTAYVVYDRSPSGESRVDWTIRASLAASAYANENGLSHVTGTISPGISVFLNPVWSLNVSPFLRGKAVDDSDQSAVAFGVQAILSQKWSTRFSTGQYYRYTDSNADEDVYSYDENAVGVLAGVNWTPAFFTEVGYEFSHGDSFVTSRASSTAASMHGRGRGHRYGYSTAFDALVVRDTVDRHSYSITVGYDVTKAFSAALGYTYSRESGDLGSLDNHSAVIGLGYRF